MEAVVELPPVARENCDVSKQITHSPLVAIA